MRSSTSLISSTPPPPHRVRLLPNTGEHSNQNRIWWMSRREKMFFRGLITINTWYQVCFVFFFHHLLSSTRKGLCPQRFSSGQAVVTGVVPSGARFISCIAHMVGFSIPTLPVTAFRDNSCTARRSDIIGGAVQSTRFKHYGIGPPVRKCPTRT